VAAGNGSQSQVGLLLQVAEKVDGLEKRCDHFFDHFSEQMRDVKETLGVIARTLAESVQVTRVRLDDHEHRLSKLEKPG
jgi:hypothetical protein